MDPNTHSAQPPGPQPAEHPDDLAALAALDRLATRDLEVLSEGSGPSGSSSCDD
jgi:hypothetical protein